MLLAETAGNVQTLFVHSKKSSFLIEFSFRFRFLENVPLEKANIFMNIS